MHKRKVDKQRQTSDRFRHPFSCARWWCRTDAPSVDANSITRSKKLQRRVKTPCLGRNRKGVNKLPGRDLWHWTISSIRFYRFQRSAVSNCDNFSRKQHLKRCWTLTPLFFCCIHLLDNWQTYLFITFRTGDVAWISTKDVEKLTASKDF